MAIFCRVLQDLLLANHWRFFLSISDSLFVLICVGYSNICSKISKTTIAAIRDSAMLAVAKALLFYSTSFLLPPSAAAASLLLSEARLLSV
jgi:hypothetical protein